jgi:hypothetical protein
MNHIVDFIIIGSGIVGALESVDAVVTRDWVNTAF